MCKLQSIKIKGKDYVQVNERIKAFRENFKDYQLITNLHELTDDVCVMFAQVINPQGVVVATGWAREVRLDSSSMVNKTSYVENCETSAWGRALGNLGIGIDDNICSAEELMYALETQSNPKRVSTPATRPAPAPKPTPAPAPQPAPKPILPVVPQLFNDYTDDEVDELHSIYADMDSAENVNMLYSIFKKYQDKRYAHLLKAKGKEIKEERGWK